MTLIKMEVLEAFRTGTIVEYDKRLRKCVVKDARTKKTTFASKASFVIGSPSDVGKEVIYDVVRCIHKDGNTTFSTIRADKCFVVPKRKKASDCRKKLLEALATTEQEVSN